MNSPIPIPIWTRSTRGLSTKLRLLCNSKEYNFCWYLSWSKILSPFDLLSWKGCLYFPFNELVVVVTTGQSPPSPPISWFCLLTLLWLGGALCARLIFEDIFLQLFVKHYGLILSDFSYLRISWHMQKIWGFYLISKKFASEFIFAHQCRNLQILARME